LSEAVEFYLLYEPPGGRPRLAREFDPEAFAVLADPRRRHTLMREVALGRIAP